MSARSPNTSATARSRAPSQPKNPSQVSASTHAVVAQAVLCAKHQGLDRYPCKGMIEVLSRALARILSVWSAASPMTCSAAESLHETWGRSFVATGASGGLSSPSIFARRRKGGTAALRGSLLAPMTRSRMVCRMWHRSPESTSLRGSAERWRLGFDAARSSTTQEAEASQTRVLRDWSGAFGRPHRSPVQRPAWRSRRP